MVSWPSDFPQIDRALRRRLSGRRLLVGNPSLAYASVLRSYLLENDPQVAPPQLLGLATTVEALRALLPKDGGELLVATTSQLRDGCCVGLLQELLGRPQPPALLVTLALEAPALPLAALLGRPGVAIVWEGNVGQGGLLRGIEALQGGASHCDPQALERIQAAERIAGGLTEREREVLRLVVEGLTNRQIAERLVVAEVTARDHVQRILRKLEVGDRTAAAVLAVRLGLAD
ncbi:MAG: response regulator transcription factor [Synechococcaceae cyanobacterium]|nr:response regulator transcription factor [Synechococcaceae cyanobacterium]